MRLCAVLFLTCIVSSAANAADFSFRGTLSRDDDVRFFDFLVGAPSDVTLRTYSYAGGTQADGKTIAAGGFDPILALFDSSGLLIDSNDDGADVPLGPNTGEAYDTALDVFLQAGNYTVSVMQYDNFPNGPALSDGFRREGDGNFTVNNDDCSADAFCDVTGVAPFNARTNAWAFDVLNVELAVQEVPLPASLPILASSIAVLAFLRRRRR